MEEQIVGITRRIAIALIIIALSALAVPASADTMNARCDIYPKGEIRIFNPFQVRSSNMLARFIENLNDFERTNHRMHNKLLISDGKAAIVGGRNIADEYFGFNRELNFRTFDVLTTGKVLPEISAAFDVYWNSG